jgi:cytochrome c oxidase assembly factor CtaG
MWRQNLPVLIAIVVLLVIVVATVVVSHHSGRNDFPIPV